MTEIWLGLRLALAGGRDGLIRSALTAAGIGIGVAMLLLAASVPGALHQRGQRDDARTATTCTEQQTANSIWVHWTDTIYHGQPIRGRLVYAPTAVTVIPPGLSHAPAAGEVVVSPALRKLLSSANGGLLRDRLPYRIVADISADGLTGPAELAYYAGVSASTKSHAADWCSEFGWGGQAIGGGQPYDAVLEFLAVVIVVVLLWPVGVFAAAAVRFGGEQRDRRLAALRLIGSDTAMVRRVAAGEALATAAAGLLVGVVFFLLGRELAARFSVADISVYATDLNPGWLAVVLVALLVPGVAVAVTLVELRSVLIEPLSVLRLARPTGTRLWWRLLLPAAGVAVLLIPLDTSWPAGRESQYPIVQAAAGLLLLLAGVAVLLPWLILTTVSRLHIGPVPWLLAIRRLQLKSAGSPARLVNGIVAAVAGAIALQLLFTGVEPGYRRTTGANPSLANAMVHTDDATGTNLVQAFGTMPGVDRVLAYRQQSTFTDDQTGTAWAPVVVADCTTLRQLVALPSCVDGDTFRTPQPPSSSTTVPGPGDKLTFGADSGAWQVPSTTRLVTMATAGDGSPLAAVLTTPGAAPPTSPALLARSEFAIYLRIAPTNPDTIERVRNLVERLSSSSQIYDVTEDETTERFANLRRGVLIGTVLTLILIGLSLLVGILEQLRERRRVLAVLAAFGTRRATLGWSVLWQNVVPVALGLALAVPAGIGVGAVLLHVVGAPLRVQAPAVLGIAGLAAAAIVLVTVASLPALARLMRPSGLRNE